jgi:hypothetical protein
MEIVSIVRASKAGTTQRKTVYAMNEKEPINDGWYNSDDMHGRVIDIVLAYHFFKLTFLPTAISIVLQFTTTASRDSDEQVRPAMCQEKPFGCLFKRTIL